MEGKASKGGQPLNAGTRIARDKDAGRYTHSVWSGKAYGRPQTEADLIAESLAILRRHPTIGPCLANRGKRVDVAALMAGRVKAGR